MFPKNTRILIVDDTLSMREQLKKHLVDLGFTDIMEAEDGLKAFEIVSAQEDARKGIQLILSDWHMPNMSGLDFLKLVRSLDRQIPLILVTTESETPNVLAAIKAGANNYIVKPIQAATLTEKLEAVWKRLTSGVPGQSS